MCIRDSGNSALPSSAVSDLFPPSEACAQCERASVSAEKMRGLTGFPAPCVLSVAVGTGLPAFPATHVRPWELQAQILGLNYLEIVWGNIFSSARGNCFFRALCTIGRTTRITGWEVVDGKNG